MHFVPKKGRIIERSVDVFFLTFQYQVLVFTFTNIHRFEAYNKFNKVIDLWYNQSIILKIQQAEEFFSWYYTLVFGGTILFLYAHNITLKRRKESDRAHCQHHFLGLDEASWNISNIKITQAYTWFIFYEKLMVD